MDDTRSGDAPGGAPALPEPARWQRVAWAWLILTAACLLAALGVRLALHVEPAWWVPLTLVAGMVAADFLSGVVHWAADTWGQARVPVLGPWLLVPFRVHHVNPDDFLRRRFLDTNGDVAAVTIPALTALLVMPLDSTPAQVAAVIGFSLCGVGGLTNQIHQWAHMPSPPRAVRWLQRAGALLGGAGHAAHHRGRYDAHYCIATGWCNRPLEAIGFFRRLERAVTCVTGLRPRADERQTTPCA